MFADSTETYPVATANLLFVEDADATFGKALARGCKSGEMNWPTGIMVAVAVYRTLLEMCGGSLRWVKVVVNKYWLYRLEINRVLYIDATGRLN